MDNDLLKGLEEVIAANLPAQAAGQMAEFIRQAEQTKKDLAASKKWIENQNVEIEFKNVKNKFLEETLTTYKDIAEREEILLIAEETLRIRTNELELTICQTKLMESERRVAVVERLVDKVFGHPSVTICNTIDKPILTDTTTGLTPYEQGRVSETETTTTTESKI